jgi:4-aminobutyrate aminotransferase-like enzyme
VTTPTSTPAIDRDHDLHAHSAHNYHPLPVVVAEAEGAWVTDVDGRRYLDALAGYSALNFGHRHPALLAALRDQLDRVTLTSRAFHHDQFAPFCADLARLTGMDAVLPMNTGAEAVETSLKLARRWGYRVKGVPEDQAHHRRGRQQLPRPHHHDRQLLDRPRGARALRSLHTRFPHRAVRGRGRPRGRHRRDHGGGAARADPG